MVGNLRMPGRAEQDCVVLPDQIPAVLRHHPAVLFVILTTPVEMVDLEREPAITFGDCGQHVDASGNDFRADAVAWNCRDCVGFHVELPSPAKIECCQNIETA